MAKLPTQKKIMREDIKEAPSWVDRLISPINTFFETIYNALAKNITLTENIACQIKEIEFNTSSTYDHTAANWTEITFPKTIKFRANGVLLLQLIDLGAIGAKDTSYRPIEGDVCIDWQESNEEIVIGLIRGLAVSKSYRAKFLVI